MVIPAEATNRPMIPGIIKRNTFLLAVIQACVAVGPQLGPIISAALVTPLNGAPTMVALSTVTSNLGRLVVAYRIGWVATGLGVGWRCWLESRCRWAEQSALASHSLNTQQRCFSRACCCSAWD